MRMPNGYNEVQVRTGKRQLPPGGYVCRIKNAREETIRGYWQLVIAFDIDDGPDKGFFEQRYRDDLVKKDKWPGVHRVFVEDYNNVGQCSPEFKGFITSIEESNPGFIMQWGEGSERCLIGKQVGIVFREKELETDNGGIAVITEPLYVCSVEMIRRGVKTPKRKAAKAKFSAPVYNAQETVYNGSGEFNNLYEEHGDLPF